MEIRPVVAADRERLFAVWLEAVRATDQFVSSDDVAAFIPMVRDYLTAPETEFWVLQDATGRPYPLLHLRLAR